MKQVKKILTTKELESTLKHMIGVRGEFESIKPDGELDEAFILSYIIEHNELAAQDYKRIKRAFDKLKESDTFIKGMHSRQVGEDTLKRIVLYHEAIVRPIKTKWNDRNRSLYVGEIVKLPPDKSEKDYDEGEEWKALLKKERKFKVGDKVLYSYMNIIVLDNELLHIVSCFSGKFLEKSNNTINTK